MIKANGKHVGRIVTEVSNKAESPQLSATAKKFARVDKHVLEFEVADESSS